MGFDIVSFRKNYPEIWRTILFLGSLRWAVILLSTIAIACAIATFMESNFTADVARHYIYRAPWFHVWLILLCINLCCVTLTRLPWKRKHYGFVTTHYGIITLLFGAMIGSWFGYEAFVVLKKGEEPSYRLTQNESVLIVQSPQDQAFYSIPLPVEVRKPTPESPKIMPVPDSDLLLKVDGYAAHLERVPSLTPSSDADASYGTIIELSSTMAGQKLQVPFTNASAEPQAFDFFGMAKVVWVRDIPSFLQSMNSWSENQMIFQSSQPILSNNAGVFSGYQSTLVMEKTPLLKIQTPEGKTLSFSIGSKFPQKIDLQNPLIQATVNGYWPDFEMKDGKPLSKSTLPQNPALLVRIQGKQAIDKHPHLLLSSKDEKNINFSLVRNGESYASGALTPGKPVSTGWAQWMVEVKSIEAKSHLEYHIEPREPRGEESIPGIRTQLLDKTKKPLSDQKWIISGETETMAISSTQVIQVAFGLKTRQIPFGVQLNHFEVPRDEGTDTPAAFISTLWFYNENHQLAREDHAEMNYPATYPGGFWRSVIGQNYKFSQASWNPQNLGESTLQILYDPGWPLKWIGSMMISVGIIIMFYFKDPKKKPSAPSSP